MTLHDELLLQKVVKLARQTFFNINLLSAQTIAWQAMKNNWPDFIIATCWLCNINTLDGEDAIVLIEQVKEFSPETSSVLETLKKKENEDNKQYYRRISESPFARAVLWLYTLNKLTYETDNEMAQNMLAWLPPLYPLDVISKYRFGMSG